MVLGLIGRISRFPGGFLDGNICQALSSTAHNCALRPYLLLIPASLRVPAVLRNN